eukprot:326970-Rhodomonas_salina.1
MGKFASKVGVNSIEADARNSPKVAILAVDDVLDYTGKGCGESTKGDSSSDGSSVNTALIGGIVGAAVGAVVIGVGALLFMRGRKGATLTATPVQTINVQDLKAQLADDL